jgi:hypothetical protein
LHYGDLEAILKHISKLLDGKSTILGAHKEAQTGLGFPKPNTNKMKLIQDVDSTFDLTGM